MWCSLGSGTNDTLGLFLLQQSGSGQQQHPDHRDHRWDTEAPHSHCSPLRISQVAILFHRLICSLLCVDMYVYVLFQQKSHPPISCLYGGVGSCLWIFKPEGSPAFGSPPNCLKTRYHRPYLEYFPPPPGESATRRCPSVSVFCPAGWRFRMWAAQRLPFVPAPAPR